MDPEPKQKSRSLFAEILERYGERVPPDNQLKPGDREYLDLDPSVCENMSIPQSIFDTENNQKIDIPLKQDPPIKFYVVRGGSNYSLEIHRGERPAGLDSHSLDDDHHIDSAHSTIAHYRLSDNTGTRLRHTFLKEPHFWLEHRIVKKPFRGKQSSVGHNIGDIMLRMCEEIVSKKPDGPRIIALRPAQLSVMCSLIRNGYEVAEGNKAEWEKIKSGHPDYFIGANSYIKQTAYPDDHDSPAGGERILFTKKIQPSSSAVEEVVRDTKEEITGNKP